MSAERGGAVRCGAVVSLLLNVNEGNGRQTSNTIARKASGLHASLCYGASVDEREIGRESKGGEKGKREGKYEICYKNDARVSKLDEHDAVYRKNAQGSHVRVMQGTRLWWAASLPADQLRGNDARVSGREMRKGLREKKTVEGGGGGGEEQLANWQLLRSWRLTISLWMACNTSGFLSL